MLRNLPILGALIACFCFQSLTHATPNDDGPPAKKRAGAEARQRDSNAATAERPGRPEGQAGAVDRQRSNRDPAKMASMMMQKFDQDADEKLNAEELTAMLTFLQERRGQQGGGDAGKGNRQLPGVAKRLEGKQTNADEVGGVTPRRPPAE